MKPTCPICSSIIVIEAHEEELIKQYKMYCPTHGYLGTAEEVRNRSLDESRESFDRQEQDDEKRAIEDLLRRATF